MEYRVGIFYRIKITHVILLKTYAGAEQMHRCLQHDKELKHHSMKGEGMTKFVIICIMFSTLLISCGAEKKDENMKVEAGKSEWTSLFNGKNLDGWFVRGKAKWEVRDSILTGIGGMGHIYAEPVVTDFEAKGMFRVSENGNSGFYFRCNPPKDDPDGFPRGYEAQIDNHQKAFTGWLWKPGTPTAEAKALITKDNEWFSMHIQAVGDNIKIWVNGILMVNYHDSDYSQGHFAIQGHNAGMTIEAKELYYRVLSN